MSKVTTNNTTPSALGTASDADAVNSPAHYNTGKIEVIDFIEDQRLGFHEGNVVKYVSRAKHKGRELEDLKKAAWYLNRRIGELETGK